MFLEKLKIRIKMYITWDSSVIAEIHHRQDGSYDSWPGLCLLTAVSRLELGFTQPPFQCWVLFFPVAKMGTV